MNREVSNKLFLLRLLKSAEKIQGATRLQKLVFVSEKIGRKEDLTTFNYSFIRWHYGPYCSEIKDDISFLKDKNLIVDNNNTYQLTQAGEELLEKKAAADYIIQSKIDNIFNDVLFDLANMPLDKLLKKVYIEYNIEGAYEKGEEIESII